MIDFKSISKEKLNELESEREKFVPNMFIETKSENVIINELRFNYRYLFIGYALINGHDGTNLELSITDLEGKYGEKNIHIGFIGVTEENRRKGIGHSTMKLLTELADKHGYDMDLDIDTKFGVEYKVLENFYKKHGFEFDEDYENKMVRCVKLLK